MRNIRLGRTGVKVQAHRLRNVELKPSFYYQSAPWQELETAFACPFHAG